MVHRIYVFLFAITFIAWTINAASTPTAKATPGSKPTTTPSLKPSTTPKPQKKEKYACQQCIGKGTDCKGSASLKTNDYCAKIVGIVDSSTGSVPAWAEPLLSVLVKPGVKAKDYEGQTITIRIGVTEASMKQAGYEARADCGAFEKYGLRGYGCTCEGDCKEPNSPTAPKEAKEPNP